MEIPKLSNEKKTELMNEVSSIATEFINEKLVGKYPIANSFETLEQLGFFIVSFPANNDDLSGLHINKSGFDCIFVNGDHSLGRQYYSAWHECYHAYTGEESSISFQSVKNDPIEFKAEYFASLVLMPVNEVRKYIINSGINLNYLSHIQLIRMQYYFGVSYSAMLRRLIELYPVHKPKLGTHYNLGSVSKHESLRSKTIEACGDTRLIMPTKGLYISESFFEDLKFNVKENRISESKAHSVISLIESVGTLYGK